MRRVTWIILGLLALVPYSAYADEAQDKALVSAASNGNLEEIKRLLAAGANVDSTDYSKDQEGLQAIHYAVNLGNIKEVNVLLAAGAKADAIDFNGRQPIHYAALNGNTELVKVLLAAGAKVDASDQYGKQPLHFAADKNKIEVVKLLIAAGANLEAGDQNGMQPIYRAALAGNTEVVKLLIAAGAKADTTDKYGNHLIQDVEKKGHTEVGRILREAATNPPLTAQVQSTRMLPAIPQNKKNSNIIAQGVALPKNVADYFVQTAGNWENGNPYDGEISVSKISTNIYRVDYNFQQPIGMDATVAIISTLNECLANYIADKTHSPGWDVGRERDMFDRNFGRPFSNLTYLILTGAKDGETREHATGRKTVYWTYGEILDNKSLRYENSYPSVTGECKKLLKPEFSKHTPADMAMDPIKEINGGFAGGLLNLVKPEYTSGEASIGYEARISVEPISSNFYRVKYSYPDPVEISKEGAAMFYSLTQSAVTMCIGGYLAGKRGYEVWDIGMGQVLNQIGTKDGFKTFDYYVLINPKDGVSRVKATGRKDISWIGAQSSYELLKSANRNSLVVCRKLLNPEFVPK